MITDDPKASDIIIEEGRATPMFFSFIDQVTNEINTGLATTDVSTTSLTVTLAGIYLVDDDAAGGAVTVTLPPAVNQINPIHIKKLGTTGAVTISGSETIDGAANQTLTTQYESISLWTDGANYYVI